MYHNDNNNNMNTGASNYKCDNEWSNGLSEKVSFQFVPEIPKSVR